MRRGNEDMHLSGTSHHEFVRPMFTPESDVDMIAVYKESIVVKTLYSDIDITDAWLEEHKDVLLPKCRNALEMYYMLRADKFYALELDKVYQDIIHLRINADNVQSIPTDPHIINDLIAHKERTSELVKMIIETIRSSNIECECSGNDIPYFAETILLMKKYVSRLADCHIEYAAEHGLTESIKYIRSVSGVEKDHHISCIAAIKLAARGGHLECLMILCEIECGNDNGVCNSAAMGGHLECLKFLHKIGYKCGVQTVAVAAEHGHIECIRFLYDIGCGWNDGACYRAAKNGHLQCLRFLCENADRPDTQISEGARASRDARILRNSRIPRDALADCVVGRLVATRPMPIAKEPKRDTANVYTFAGAASGGHLDCIEYLHSIRCPCDAKIFESAAKNGHLECIKYLIEHEYPCDESACIAAARGGYLDCVKYMHENGCPWNEWAYIAAAENGHLAVIMYLRESRCVPTEGAYLAAAGNGHFDCIEYMYVNEFPVPDNICDAAARGRNLRCLQYMHEQGFQCDEDTCASAAKGAHS
jgi:hypothetical protein